MSGLEKYTPKQVFSNDAIHRRFEKVLGEKSRGFVTSVLQIINDNGMLADAESESVFNAAMTAATLDLPINPNLGFAYIIPYRNNKLNKVVAQFQMGYKGYIQLAQRSGLYKTISAAPIYEGQLIDEDPLRGFEFDFDVKVSDKVIGYAAYFRLLNGFEKYHYMSREQVEEHAKTYSKTYSKKDKKFFGVWADDFDSMAIKTVLKLLISKYGPMTVDLERAIQVDQAEIKDPNDLTPNYLDNPKGEVEQPTEGRQPVDIQKGDEDSLNRDGIMQGITERVKSVHGESYYKEIKSLVADINPEAGNMLDLSDEELMELDSRTNPIEA